jgi:rare lipoprotein A
LVVGVAVEGIWTGLTSTVCGTPGLTVPEVGMMVKFDVLPPVNAAVKVNAAHVSLVRVTDCEGACVPHPTSPPSPYVSESGLTTTPASPVIAHPASASASASTTSGPASGLGGAASGFTDASGVCVPSSGGFDDELLHAAARPPRETSTVTKMNKAPCQRRPGLRAWVCMNTHPTARIEGMAANWSGPRGITEGAGPLADAVPLALALAVALAAAAGASAGCGHATEMDLPPATPTATFVERPVERPAPVPRVEVQVGLATWYGGAFAGRRTASGEPFNPLAMTAAHRTLPFGTWVEVTRADTGESVRVRITDRGPFGHEDRIIDLSRGAAERIGLVRTGVARVELRVVDAP